MRYGRKDAMEPKIHSDLSSFFLGGGVDGENGELVLGTGYQLGKMKKFWRWMDSKVNWLDATELYT